MKDTPSREELLTKPVKKSDLFNCLVSPLHDGQVTTRPLITRHTLQEKKKQALRNQDAPQVARIAHTIKGSSANIGANNIRETAQEMEIAGKDQDLGLAQTLVNQIEREFDKLGDIILEAEGL